MIYNILYYIVLLYKEKVILHAIVSRSGVKKHKNAH